jgi:diguanylate cyclase (GGDEF)-like protein
MPIWFKCFRLISIIALLFLAFASHGARSDELTTATPQKINEYADLLHKVIYDWNYPSALSNEAIEQQIIKSGVQQDESSIGVIFRHLMALSTADTGDHQRVPIYIKSPLLDQHWQALKEAAPSTYAYAHAYFLYVRSVIEYKGSARRVISTIPELSRHKAELLKTGDKSAVAIASMWLAMEYLDTAPLKAISEIEYALPHVSSGNFSNALENELDKPTALIWLSHKYLELKIPSKALEYATQFIEIKRQKKTLVASDYVIAIRAAISLSKTDLAQALVEKAKSAAKEDIPLQEYIALALELTVFIDSYITNNKSTVDEKRRIASVAQKLQNFEIDDIPSQFKELEPFSKAVESALLSDSSSFEQSVEVYKTAINEQGDELAFTRNTTLNGLLGLRDLHLLREGTSKAFHYQRKYDDAIVKYNTELFRLNDTLGVNSLSKDIELANYRQRELETLRNEKLGLTASMSQLETTVIALLAAIFGILSMWLWLTKKQNASSSQFDSLTGALTRRAMLNSLKKALKRDSSSCVALLDIDKFKRINEKFGHEVGDEVLATFSQTIRGRIRKSDKLCRYGNEEFLIYFTDSNESHVKHVLDELNQSLSKLTIWKHTSERFAVSFSSGVLKVDGDANLDTVIQCCDKLLQTAKQKGHSQIETYALSVC